MIIPIDENTRIVGDDQTWNVERLPKKKEGSKNEPKWSAASYCSTFHHAVSVACQREIRLHPAYGVNEALEAIEGILQKYTAIFDVNNEIINASFPYREAANDESI